MEAHERRSPMLKCAVQRSVGQGPLVSTGRRGREPILSWTTMGHSDFAPCNGRAVACPRREPVRQSNNRTETR